MIAIFVLAVVLFVAASLGWGVIFYSGKTLLTRKVHLLVFFSVIASSAFSSIFFQKGLADAGNQIGPITSSLVFTLVFVVTLFAGFVLSALSQLTVVFSFVEGMWKGGKQEDDRADAVGDLLERITQTGEIDALEQELIESILKFKDKIVREVMVPRGDIVAINVEEDPRRVLRRVAEEGYSRMPVYSGSIDNIVGIIYAKDLITMAEGSGAIVLQDILRSPYYVPESKKISQLLREMQRNKVHLAIVVDEFGGTEGIVTLEDVLEEIVGEIQDEYDESLSELTRDEDGDIHFAGSMSVDRFNELLEADIPREEDYDTMAGFVQKLAGKLPQKGEVYGHGEMFFIIEEVARHRIKRLKVSFKEHPSLSVPSRAFGEPANNIGPSARIVESLSSVAVAGSDDATKKKGASKRGTRKKKSNFKAKPVLPKNGRGTGKKQ